MPDSYQQLRRARYIWKRQTKTRKGANRHPPIVDQLPLRHTTHLKERAGPSNYAHTLHLVGRQITIFTSNQGALLAASQPTHQSGQTSIEEIYEVARMLRKRRNSVSMIWVPSQGSFELGRRAKEAARQATEPGRTPQGRCYQAKSTVINYARAEGATRTLLNGVGKYSTEMDTALPGKHTRTLYDTLKRKEASELAQLRTEMARLNRYLHQIGAAESDQC